MVVYRQLSSDKIMSSEVIELRYIILNSCIPICPKLSLYVSAFLKVIAATRHGKRKLVYIYSDNY